MKQYLFLVNLFGNVTEIKVTAVTENDARQLIKANLLRAALESKVRSTEYIPAGVLTYEKIV